MRVRPSFAVLFAFQLAASSAVTGLSGFGLPQQQPQQTSGQATPSQAQNAQSVELSPVVDCMPIFVEGDTTFCVMGRKCSAPDSALPGTNCPKKGAIGISLCSSTFKSYNAAGNNCVAPHDAQCQKLKSGEWGCAFPDVPAAASREVASEAATTSISLETVGTSHGVATHMDDAAKPVGVSQSEYANNNKADITAKTAPENTGAATAGVGAVNIAVAAAALVVAAVGVAAVRKRQKSDRTHQTPHKRHNSIRNLGCMELGTPL